MAPCSRSHGPWSLMCSPLAHTGRSGAHGRGSWGLRHLGGCNPSEGSAGREEAAPRGNTRVAGTMWSRPAGRMCHSRSGACEGVAGWEAAHLGNTSTYTWVYT